MNADGSGRRVVGVPDPPSYATWAPNGKIVFVSAHLGSGDILRVDLYAVNPDGSGLQRLTKGADMILPSVSPDGSTIAAYATKTDRLIAVPYGGDGPAVTLLADASEYFLNGGRPLAHWAPDGKTLVLGSSNYGEVGGAGLYIVNADGSGLAMLPVTQASAPTGSRSKDVTMRRGRPVAGPGPLAPPEAGHPRAGRWPLQAAGVIPRHGLCDLDPQGKRPAVAGRPHPSVARRRRSGGSAFLASACFSLPPRPPRGVSPEQQSSVENDRQPASRMRRAIRPTAAFQLGHADAALGRAARLRRDRKRTSSPLGRLRRDLRPWRQSVPLTSGWAVSRMGCREPRDRS